METCRPKTKQKQNSEHPALSTSLPARQIFRVRLAEYDDELKMEMEMGKFDGDLESINPHILRHALPRTALEDEAEVVQSESPALSLSFVTHIPVGCTQSQRRTGHVQYAVRWRHIIRISLFRGQACSSRRRACAGSARSGRHGCGADTKRAASSRTLGRNVSTNRQRRVARSARVVVWRCLGGRLVFTRRPGVGGRILEMRVGS
jgi:hypothetical protein